MFKELREQKGYSLSYFDSVSTNKAQISKFERGESMMGFDKVMALLDFMKVSLAEYEFFLNHFEKSWQEEFLNNLEVADILGDVKTIETMGIEALNAGQTKLFLMTQACTKSLNKYFGCLFQYELEKIEFWGELELSLAYYSLDIITTESILALMTDFYEKNKNHFGISKYRRLILQICYRAVVIMVKRDKPELAKKILFFTKDIRIDCDMFLSNLRHLVSGYYQVKFGNEAIGKKKIEVALTLFEDLGGSTVRAYYQRRLIDSIKQLF